MKFWCKPSSLRGVGAMVVSSALIAGVTLAGVASAPGVAAAAPAIHVTTVGTYLALGDSVAFGYVPPNAVVAPHYRDASSFVGYPEDLGRALDLKVANASCPGETTMSFLAAGALSNGCENSPTSSVGYRTVFPLHVKYSGTQMAYAIDYLQNNPTTQLVTIDIGANDAFICEEATADKCVSEFPALLAQIRDNLSSIYQQLRDVAGYQGTIVALTYYSTSYSNRLLAAETKVLDSTIAAVTREFGGLVANGFQAFEGPSAKFGGSPCAAGLLIRVKRGTCNIHPSPLGHLLLAAAIAKVLPG